MWHLTAYSHEMIAFCGMFCFWAKHPVSIVSNGSSFDFFHFQGMHCGGGSWTYDQFQAMDIPANPCTAMKNVRNHVCNNEKFESWSRLFWLDRDFFETFIPIDRLRPSKICSRQVRKFEIKLQTNPFFCLSQGWDFFPTFLPSILTFFQTFWSLESVSKMLQCLDSVSSLYCNCHKDLHTSQNGLSKWNAFLLWFSHTCFLHFHFTLIPT